MKIEPGDNIAGHRLVERIAGGHYGEVWRAEYLDQEVALKVFTRMQKASRAGLQREALAQYALGRLEGEQGRFFPRVEHVELDAQPPWIRMELVHGAPLEVMLLDASLSLQLRLEIARQILEGLAAVHAAGFVHGDLSPRNVLLCADGIRLIDVGFGALFDEGGEDVVASSGADDPPMGVASPLYAAPERFQSEFLEGCGKASDVFAFGKLLYHLITGESPFVVKPVSRKFPALGERWDAFIFRCLEERPENRFADAGAALEEYRALAGPATVEGEYRFECPECKHSGNLPGGRAGERLNCAKCGTPLEVLFYDEQGFYAATAVVEEREERGRPDIEFLEPGEAAQARKFCPGCGEGIEVGARDCPKCGKRADNLARKLAAESADQRREHRRKRAQSYSYVGIAWLTFLGYICFWLPGAILNWLYLDEAIRTERRIGSEPPGKPALLLMIWLFVYLPLLGLGGMLVLAVLFGLLNFGFC